MVKLVKLLINSKITCGLIPLVQQWLILFLVVTHQCCQNPFPEAGINVRVRRFSRTCKSKRRPSCVGVIFASFEVQSAQSQHEAEEFWNRHINWSADKIKAFQHWARNETGVWLNPASPSFSCSFFLKNKVFVGRKSNRERGILPPDWGRSGRKGYFLQQTSQYHKAGRSNRNGVKG